MEKKQRLVGLRVHIREAALRGWNHTVHLARTADEKYVGPLSIVGLIYSAGTLVVTSLAFVLGHAVSDPLGWILGTAVLVAAVAWMIVFGSYQIARERSAELSGACRWLLALRVVIDGESILARMKSSARDLDWDLWRPVFEEAKLWQRRRLPEVLKLFGEQFEGDFHVAKAPKREIQHEWSIVPMWVPAIEQEVAALKVILDDRWDDSAIQSTSRKS